MQLRYLHLIIARVRTLGAIRGNCTVLCTWITTMAKTEEVPSKCGFEDALNATGFGVYTIWMLISNCCLILAMYLDIFGFSVILPAAACDLGLSTTQQGLLSALPLVGVMLSSYAWGLCADTLGRRATLLLAMPVGAALNLAAGIAPNYASLATFKFLSACFTSSANAAGFVLVGECSPMRVRSRFMFLMASATMFVQFVICCFALPVFMLSFKISIPWLSLEYRPWRLLMHILSLPGIIGVINMAFLAESPKFLLSKGKDGDALKVLQRMYKWNSGKKIETYPVETLFLEEDIVTYGDESFLRRMWNQTAPLFKPPLLKNSLKLYYILLTAYMTSTGYTIWVPTMTNAYFTGADSSGLTFCEVASQTVATNKTTMTDCDRAIQPLTLYATMTYSFASGCLTILLSFLVGPLGKKYSSILVFVVSAICGLMLLFVKIPVLSIILFYMFLYVALILGNINSYLVELNPTHLRGMATCLSVVVARGLGFISVQLIAALLADHCTPMIAGYVVLVLSGLVVAFFLPQEIKQNDTSR